MADPSSLGILMGDDLVEPVAQPILRPFLPELTPVSPGHEGNVEYPRIDVDLVSDNAAAVPVMGKEGPPPAARVEVGTADLILGDSELSHPLCGVVVHRLRVPPGEIMSVCHGIGPHAAPGWWRADHRRLAAQAIEDLAEWIHQKTARRGRI
jgi:hypothetical protein